MEIFLLASGQFDLPVVSAYKAISEKENQHEAIVEVHLN